MQGIAGHGYYDTCVVPIIDNTARYHIPIFVHASYFSRQKALLEDKTLDTKESPTQPPHRHAKKMLYLSPSKVSYECT